MEKTTEPALTPDPQSAADFHVPDNKFAYTPGHLNKLLNPKSLAAFRALGGLRGLEYGLRTDLRAGLSADEGVLCGYVGFAEVTEQYLKAESSSPSPPSPSPSPSQQPLPLPSQFADRIRVFGENQIPPPKRKTFLRLLWDAYNDKIMILLTIAAVISLSLGVYEAASGQSQVDWIEGVAICVAILIVVAATAGNDWQKERQFAKLNRRKADRDVTATRSGKQTTLRVFDLLVGDILHLQPGDSPPADGILISSHGGLKTDESAATGESDQMKKMDGDEVWEAITTNKDMDLDSDLDRDLDLDPFIISGSKVLEGMGTYLVTSVGRYSTSGRIMASLQSETEPTPLQVKLGRLAGWIGWFGSGAALILFTVLLIRFLANLPDNHNPPTVKGQHFMDILIVAVTVIVVAIPEGLPLAVTLALAFATTRMVKENNLVRLLRACETMGNATVICSDKTGTLTQNRMTVVAGVLGWQDRFHQHVDVDADVVNADNKTSTSPPEVLGRLSPALRDLLVKSVGLDSTAFEEERDGGKTFVGSKTEVALLQFAKEYLGMDIVEERANAQIVHVFPFDSARKSMGVVYRHGIGVKGEGGGGYRLLVKGAAEIMLDASRDTVVTCEKGGGARNEVMSNEARTAVARAIDVYARESLRTIGMVYKDFAGWPPVSTDGETVAFEDLFQEMTWIGIVGIHDPLRPEVSGAIKTCGNAGVQVKMVTGDNINTATSIATSCGIKTPTGLVMEGPQFRKLPAEEMTKVIPRLQVLARSSPDDKRILVQHLKTLGETVAVTGDGTNDGPALKAADVGFSMGLSGTEIAKEASAIILLDDNFKSIVTAIAWGRSVNDAVAKFLQFQITVNITAVALTMVTAIYSSDNESVLNAVQLLWVNLIMDTFAALALATDAPTDKILNRPPVPKSAPLFTPTMWKMILGQTIYKLTICLLLYFAGSSILHYDSSRQLELDTIIFNTFVWMQIFNELNNRRLDNKLNIFERVHRNYWFLGINAVMVGGQILIIFVGGAAIGVTPLDGVQWAVCLGFAVLCIPWAAVLKFVPDEWVAVVIEGVGWVGRWIGRRLCWLKCWKRKKYGERV